MRPGLGSGGTNPLFACSPRRGLQVVPNGQQRLRHRPSCHGRWNSNLNRNQSSLQDRGCCIATTASLVRLATTSANHGITSPPATLEARTHAAKPPTARCMVAVACNSLKAMYHTSLRHWSPLCLVRQSVSTILTL